MLYPIELITMKIIGHRGAKGLEEENSLEAINTALKYKVDEIELDVRYFDEEVILSHDTPSPTQSYVTLSEALEAIDGRVPIILDIKEHIAQQIYDITKDYPGKIIYSSKIFTNLRHLYSLNKNLELATIESWSTVRAVAESALIRSRRLHLKHNWLWEGVVRSMRAKGFAVYAYTVNSQARADELYEWGISGIFTDYPDKFEQRRYHE